jgi:hypothetical protein
MDIDIATTPNHVLTRHAEILHYKSKASRARIQ